MQERNPGQDKWVIPSNDERCIYPTMVYGVKYPIVVYGIKEVVTQTPIPDIPWHIIDPRYKHAVMERIGIIWFYEEAPKFNHTTGTWQVTEGDFVGCAFLSSPAGVVAECSLTSRPE